MVAIEIGADIRSGSIGARSDRAAVAGGVGAGVQMLPRFKYRSRQGDQAASLHKRYVNATDCSIFRVADDISVTHP
jgi:hypothetical protein